MKIAKTAVLLLCVSSLGSWSYAAPQDPSNAMKDDSKKTDSMSPDKMAKDKMSQDMAKTLKGWITDSACAAHGDKMCGNKEHVAQGAKLVLVTDGNNKVWTVSNPETVADHQGHHVQVKATADEEKGTVNVQNIKMLQGK